MQRLDLRSHKTSHRFTGVKIPGRKRAFTLENRLSRQFHGIFTVISRYFAYMTDRYAHTKTVVSRHVGVELALCTLNVATA